ncbi:MAG TPA: DsrE/DsrF/DrsH-like family protein [Conexivisphaerales archaeon]|nr:DsrE/DsrF/DrsH-like family protein [Conexivisphaerales archaeon]
MTQLTARETAEKTQQEERLLIILSKGTMDMAAPALMIATAGATMGKDVHMFFTFWGMDAINKRKYGSLKVSPVGNPGMPMPNILGMIPGMTAMATGMMKGKMEKTKMPSIPEMFKMAKDLGVKFHACSTTMQVMGLDKANFIPEVDDIVGATTMLELGEGGQIIFI